ncbi:MAG: class I SAM-dependent methyltransferase [Candidatus Korobacteraceae bacterium]|jgi:methylase of polypeptide subunit release factors
MNPLRLGTDEEFGAVRHYLNASGFTLQAVVTRLRQTLPYDFTRFRPGPNDSDPQDSLELLIRVFVLGETTTPAQMAPLMPIEICTAMYALGLLSPYPDPPQRIYSPVALCPVENVFVVSDRWSMPGNEQFKLAADSVYPALTLNAQVFLNSISRQPCDNLLDLCSGTGVAALLAAAGFARQAMAADIAGRCVSFAEFNCRLNALSNISVIQSDVYSALQGQTFDRILAHPPYVPVLRPKWVYHDGGADGEDITRRIIQNLPEFLRPGGTFQCHTMASDRELALEQRIRQWLGEVQAEFDVLLVIWERMDPVKFAVASAVKDGSLEDLETWKKLLEEWKVQTMLDVSITMVRHAEACVPLDIRRSGANRSRPPEADWVLRWQRISGLPQVYEALLRSCPIAAESLKLVVTHVIEADELRAAYCRANVEYPFHVDVEIDRWMPLLLAACNGQRTGLELFEMMRQQEHIPAETEPAKFGALLSALVSSGFIIVPEFAPPAAIKTVMAGQ